MNLNDISQQVLSEMNEDGTIKKIIRKQMEDTVAQMSRDMFSNYSDFGKKLKTHVESTLHLNLSQINLADFSATINDIVAKQLNDTAYVQAVSPIQNTIKDILGELDKSQYDLSDIIRSFKKHSHKEGRVQIEIREPEYSSIWVYISIGDTYPDKLTISIKEKTGELWYYSAGDVSPRNSFLNKGMITDFERLMFRLYTNRALINIDNEYYDGYEEDEEDDDDY